MLKDYLARYKLSFTEKLVDQDEEAKNEMVQSSNGFLGVPFTTVEKEGGTIEGVIGFDKGKLDSLLGIT